MSTDALPLILDANGPAVHDLRCRLGNAGFFTTIDPPATYGPETEAAVVAFQRSRGLEQDGSCGPQTWRALVEADHHFGDRTLYFRQPMLRGDDVSELQRRLGSLGFDCGRVDGIFGHTTENSIGEFQRNVALTADGLCGRDTFAALGRIAHRTTQTSVGNVRERERLRSAADAADTPGKIMIGDFGRNADLADTLATFLRSHGIDVVVITDPDGSSHAQAANDFDATGYIGLLSDDPERMVLSYFRTEGFQSVGGHHLAQVISLQVPDVWFDVVHSPVGMRTPVLRETRMPAVVCRFGPSLTSVPDLARSLATAVTAWLTNPVEG